jgi:hypothetical protein
MCFSFSQIFCRHPFSPCFWFQWITHFFEEMETAAWRITISGRYAGISSHEYSHRRAWRLKHRHTHTHTHTQSIEEKRRDMEMGVGSQPFLPMGVAGRTKSSGCHIWIRKKKTFTTDEFSFACWGCDWVSAREVSIQTHIRFMWCYIDTNSPIIISSC